MSYIQFRDQKEVLATGQKTVGFLTEDHRLHDSVKILMPDGILKELSPEDVLAVFKIKTSLEVMCNCEHKLTFEEFSFCAGAFEGEFRKRSEALGHKLQKENKNAEV